MTHSPMIAREWIGVKARARAAQHYGEDSSEAYLYSLRAREEADDAWDRLSPIVRAEILVLSLGDNKRSYWLRSELEYDLIGQLDPDDAWFAIDVRERLRIEDGNW